nr:MAG TPA: hypothetical protein [Caudoviricetes sp.]
MISKSPSARSSPSSVSGVLCTSSSFFRNFAEAFYELSF